jgi:hypothetical protein
VKGGKEQDQNQELKVKVKTGVKTTKTGVKTLKIAVIFTVPKTEGIYPLFTTLSF